MSSTDNLLESDKLYVRLQAKLEFKEKQYLSAINDYLNSSKKVDRDKSLVYRTEIRMIKQTLELIKNEKPKSL